MAIWFLTVAKHEDNGVFMVTGCSGRVNASSDFRVNATSDFLGGVLMMARRSGRLNVSGDYYVTGGRFDRQFHPMSVCSESHKSAIVACVLVRWHSWTWFVYVVGPIRLVSWPAWRASSGAVSPQTQARRACQLNRKHSRFRGRTCGHNAGFLMCFGQQ